MDFYHRAALIIDALDAKKGSVKGLCMAEAKRGKFGKEGEAARFLKVVVEVLKYRPHLEHLLAHSKLLTAEPTLFVVPVWSEPSAPKIKSAAAATKAINASKWANKKVRRTPSPPSLALVMLHDLLFAKRGLTLPKEHKLRKKLEKYREMLDKENDKCKKKKKVSSNEGLQIALPDSVAQSIEGIGKGKKREAAEHGGEEGEARDVRWLRVNTIKWTVEEAVEWLENERWELAEDVEIMLDIAKEKSKVYALDAHIEPLLAFPAALVLPSLPPYVDGRLIAQDKASCMPPWVLLHDVLVARLEAEEELEGNDSRTQEEKDDARETARKAGAGVKVLDATAAPGNKTSFASALAGEDGRVVAVERDQGRYKVLKSMCQKAGCRNVAPMNVDFLAIDPNDDKHKNITHFLVDPSCSGSGIPSRLDYLIPEVPSEETAQRVQKLANFQVTILSHAMRFQGARRVVYSTCSVYAQEDEGVVMRILAKPEFKERGWKLAPREECIPSWERRGRVEECGGDKEIADSVIRALPEDGTNGFFVACFVRDPDAAVTIPPGGVSEGAGSELTHAERQEAFKAKSKAKGGKGAPASVRIAAKQPKPEKAPAAKPAVTEGAKPAKKKVEGKKAAFLAEAARRKAAKAAGEPVQKKQKAE